METISIQREIGIDLTFIGQEIVSVASTPDQSDNEYYSGYINEWTELKIYRTQTSAFACSRTTRIAFDDEGECVVPDQQQGVTESVIHQI